MAVENLTATWRHPLENSATAKAIPTASLNVLSSVVEVTAAASATSTYLVARLPSNARLQPQSAVGLDDLASTGSPTLDIGTFNSAGSVADDDDSINDGMDLATASTGLRMIKDVDDWGKPLWEIHGESEDPGGTIDVYATIKDAATNTGGTLAFSLVYSVD